MKYTILTLCFLLLTCATNKENTSYYSFTQENNININYSINDSQFVGNDFIIYELTKDFDYGFCINFYSTEKLAPYSTYDNDKEYWRTSNIALFRIEDDQIIFIGGTHNAASAIKTADAAPLNTPLSHLPVLPSRDRAP